jgi:hypothetical protein
MFIIAVFNLNRVIRPANDTVPLYLPPSKNAEAQFLRRFYSDEALESQYLRLAEIANSCPAKKCWK